MARQGSMLALAGGRGGWALALVDALAIALEDAASGGAASVPRAPGSHAPHAAR